MERTETVLESARVLNAPLAVTPRRVVIHVAGGLAQIVSKPPGVIVEVHDFDSLSESGETVEVFPDVAEVRDCRIVSH